MTLIDDLTRAIHDYPDTDVQLEIVDVTFPGDVVNVLEEGRFRVRVTNNGALILRDVTVKVNGLHGMLVSNTTFGSELEEEAFTQPIDTVAAHGGSQLSPGSPMSFKAPGAPAESRTLLELRLHNWDGDMAHMLIGHSDPLDTVKGTFAAEVHDE
jgi:hypothetical protein